MALQNDGGGSGGGIPGNPEAVMAAAETLRGAATSVGAVVHHVRHHGDTMTAR